MDSARFDQVASGLYAAAAGREPWGRALDRLSDGIVAWAVQLIGVDARSGALLFSHDGGNATPEAALDDIRTYHQSNPRLAPTLALGAGEWFHDHEHFDDGFVAGSAFYQDFLIPHGGRYGSATKIVDDADRLVFFAALRSTRQQPFDADARRELDRIRIHLEAALANQTFVQGERVKSQVGALILDQFDRPMLLIDAERSVRYANRAARKALECSDYLVERSGALRCRDASGDQALSSALYELRLTEGLHHTTPAPNRRFVRTTARSDGTPIGIYLSALRPELTMASFGPDPQALVFFHDVRTTPGLDAFVVAETFGLTPAEAGVAVALASGHTVERIAAMRAVSVPTVRTQLNSAYAKTNTRRQAELVRLVLAMPEFLQS